MSVVRHAGSQTRLLDQAEMLHHLRFAPEDYEVEAPDRAPTRVAPWSDASETLTMKASR
jgi:hypothetical protein